MDLKYDNSVPQDILDEVEKELDKMFENYPKGMGFCHIYWNRKKQLLAKRGINWSTPAELNPNVIFD